MGDQAADTYRYLRLMIMLPAAWLLVSIPAAAFFGGDLDDSISDYYATPLRDVFVGTLMASGLCMIIYKGRSKIEDYALNFAGLNAFLVALVPNSFQELLDEASDEAPVALQSELTRGELLHYLQFTVIGFLLVVVAGALIDRFSMQWDRFGLQQLEKTPSKVMIVISWAGQIGLLLAVLYMLWGPGEILIAWSKYSFVHFSAAVLLIMNLVFVVATYAFSDRLRTDEERVVGQPSGLVKGTYRVLVLLMAGGIVVGFVAIAAGVDRAVLFTEVWELGLFIVFWAIATRREWSPGVQASAGG